MSKFLADSINWYRKDQVGFAEEWVTPINLARMVNKFVKVWVKVCTTKAWTPSQDLNITARACHSPNHNTRHKRAADEYVNPESIQRSPENIGISKF